MPEPTEAAVKIALMDQAIAFAAAQSPALKISLPNGVGADGRPFKNPDPSAQAQWLRANVLPAPTVSTGIATNAHNLYAGYLQIDVMQGIGGGTAPMARVIAAIAAFFHVGMKLTKDSVTVQIVPDARKQVVSEGPMMIDGSWAMIPVSIPYQCFARPA
jgi:hypothetical protein